MEKVFAMLQNTVLVLLSVVITLGAAELVLRQTSVGSYSHNRRVLFYSQPSFELLGDTAVHYVPNTKIRTVAVYGEHIDYDTVNKTNDLGFYDDVSYLKTSGDARKILFLGDSFTSGSGGSNSWVTQLRGLLGRADLDLYNFGVSGTGVANFYHLLNYAAPKMKIDEVNMMIISSDLYRNQWYPLANEEGMRFCPTRVNDADCKRNFEPVMLPVSHSASQSEILARAREIYHQKGLDQDSSRVFYQKLRLFNLMCNAVNSVSEPNHSLIASCPHLRVFRMRSVTKDNQFAVSIGILRKIRTEFPDMKFRLFHLPEKGETYRGRYSVNIAEELKQMNIDYLPLLQPCGWQTSMYHKHDGHPNDAGYTNLAECMTRYVH